MGHEKTYNDYMRSWDKMYSAENLRTVTNHDEEVKIVTLQNLARNLREEAYNRCVAEKPQDLQTVYDVLQKVKQDYETDYQDMLSQGSYPRLETEHEIVMSKLDAQIEQVGWQIINETSEKTAKKPLEEVFKKLENEIFPAVDKLIAEYGEEYYDNRKIKEQTKAYQNAASISDKSEAICLLAQAWGQSGHPQGNEIEDLFAEQLFAMNDIIKAVKVKGQERKTADNKSNSMKEGISMAWGQNTQSQNTQEQKAWGQQNNSSQKEESMAYIDKATREAMDKDPKIKDMAFKMLDKAKEIGADIKEQNLTTKGKDREGNERLNKFVVSVKPAMKYNKETGKDEMLVHKDNSPILAATINHSIGSTTLTMTAKEDMSNGVQLSSISASQFKIVKDERGKYVQKVDANNQPVTKNGKPVYAKQFERASGSEIQNGEFNQYAKAVAARIMDAGFIKEAQKDIQLDKIPEDQKTPAMKFTEFANNEFKTNGGQVMREDGSAKTDAWAKYNPPTENFGETVQLKSNSEKSIVIELSVDNENKPVAKATNFDVKLDNGRFASMYINTPADLARDELKTVPQEIKDVTADFKGFEKQREQDKPKPKQQGMEM